MAGTRRGFTMLETVVATALLAVLITVSLQMLSAQAAQRRAAQKRAVAMQEAANIIERVAAWPWQEITPRHAADVVLSSGVQKILPRGAVKLTVEPTTDAPPAKRVRVEISWAAATGGTEAPVRLNYWAYARPGDESR